MTNQLNILAISGSLRSASFNTAALRAAQELAPGDVRIHLATLADIPHYNQDVHDVGLPDAVTRLARQIGESDALLFATPEYNYSIPGILQAAIDWVSRLQPNPLADKPAAVLSASPSVLGGARAQYDLRRVLIYSNVHFINQPEVMIGAAQTRFDADGRLIDADTRQRLARLVEALAAWARRINPHR
ncbi:MAG: NAD(P)H-dependent oxidoreductase [Pseudomonadota bacterium]|nr:NAD(P)H-dependent oxidoreductase [Pseudomonadota bacterium]